MHSDAAGVGYGGTLGTDPETGSPGSWEGRGLWATEERAEAITLRELKAVRLLLQRHFASYVAQADTQRICTRTTRPWCTSSTPWSPPRARWWLNYAAWR
jgi:hypothetical protein